jgi:hypothetical protein
LLEHLHHALGAQGYDRISLSVQKKNPALRLYERCGYRTIREQDEDYIMVRRLDARRLDAQDRGRPKSDDTHLVATCIDSHSKPLADFNIEDLRIMIRQQIGLETLIPMAVSELEKDPLAKGDLYPGDLLVSVLRVPNDYWENHKEEASAVKRIIKPLNIPRSGWPGLDFDYWESVADK